MHIPELIPLCDKDEKILLYSLYAVCVSHAILYAFLVANHSTRSTLERYFGPHLKRQQTYEERETRDEE